MAQSNQTGYKPSAERDAASGHASGARDGVARGEQGAMDFLDHLGIALHQIGPGGTIIWANQAELDLLGYRRDEYLGHHVGEFYVDRAELDQVLSRLREQERLENHPAKLRAKDGSVREMLITSSAVVEDGELVHTRCVTIDVTAQKRARETSALLAAIVDSSDDAIVAKSLEGTILTWNAGAERLFGYSAAEAVGRSITLIIPPELHHEEAAILARLRRGETIDHYETVRVARDGRRLDIALTISPIRDERGRVVGASKVARDVTEQRRADAALRESEARMRTVIEALPAAVYMTDASGRLMHYNGAAIELAGRTPDPDNDQWCVSWKLYNADGTPLPLHECPMARALKEGRAIEGAEIIVERPDGSRAWAAAYPTPLKDVHGNVVNGINMLVDITERKQAEEALRDETRIAETLNRVGSTLAAELSLERIVQFVTDEVTAVTGAELGAFVHDDGNLGGEWSRIYTRSGLALDTRGGLPMPRDAPIFDATYRGEKTVRLDDVTRDPRFRPPHPGTPPGRAVRSYLAVPVISRSGDLLGGLFLGHAKPGVFTARHERIVQGIAAQAAIAMDNARLYAQVQESEQRFRELAERITDVFWIVDAVRSTLLYVSPAYETTWGRSTDSLYEAPSSMFDAIHPDDRQRVLDATERQRRGENTGEEYRIVRPDGSVRWIWDRAYAVRDEDGELVRIAGVAEDITERKLADERLRDSEESYRRLTELLPVAVYACESPSGRITYFNDQAALLWGRAPALDDPGEYYCGSVRLFLPDGEELPHEECPMAAAVTAGHSFRNQEVIMERADGSRITAIVNIEPIRDTHGRVVGAINVCLDVTALKRAEAKLREADRRKDEFLATLSHELRNPLAPLRHSLEIIKRTDDQRVWRESRDAMERQIGQMVRLIDDLLDVSRITHDKLELRREPVQLAEVVDLAVEMTLSTIEESGHRLSLELPATPVWLHADPVRIAQVLGNLLSNACKYMAPGGEIRLGGVLEQDIVVLSVQDQGKGIPAGELDLIFEMFAQADRTLSGSAGGLGIGLTLVKRLVEMHGGSVRAFSDGPGRGSTFVVRLPVAPVTVAAPPAPRPAPGAPAAQHRVLVVDDNRDSAASLATLLSMAGHETRAVFDGPEAIDAAAEFRPDVVLLDLGLPHMNGYDVCRAIRRLPGGADITVVALTGWGQEQDRQRSRDAGFDDHLVKPVDLTTVEKVLAAAPAHARPHPAG